MDEKKGFAERRLFGWPLGTVIATFVVVGIIGFSIFVLLRAFEKIAKESAHCNSLGGYYAFGDCYIDGERKEEK